MVLGETPYKRLTFAAFQPRVAVRAVLASVVLAWPTGCGDSPTEPPAEPTAPELRFAASSQTVLKGRFPLVNTVFNACTGELVDISGQQNVLVRQVISASGKSLFLLHVNVHVTGVGRTTGTEYVSNEHTNLTQHGGTGPSPVTLQFRIVSVSKGGADNVAGWIKSHMTLDADGNAVLHKSEFVFDVCSG